MHAGIFKLIGGGKGMPVVAFSLLPDRKDKSGNEIVYDEYDLADRLKERHWQLPPYTLPPNAKCVPLVCCPAAAWLPGLAQLTVRSPARR